MKSADSRSWFTAGWHHWTLALVFGCCIACGGTEEPVENPDAGLQDVDLHLDNACGGDGALTLDGASAHPGDSCGPCDDGTVVCDGVDALRCVQSTEANECGGCRPLHAFVGDLCGPCDDGTYQCDGDGGLECSGASEKNACGGCTALSAQPTDACQGDGGEEGLTGCIGPNDVRCVLPGENACGGGSELASQPGTHCGTCDQGVVACTGDDTTSCIDEDRGVNDCGGCHQLPGMVDFRCGGCDGSFICDGDNDLTCEGGTGNACGGCEDLGAFPGQQCDGTSVYVCDSLDTLTCPDDETNACGGTDTLDGVPLNTCGPCNDGQLVCVTPNVLSCSGASSTNLCGGCATLAGEPGQSCGDGGTWDCETADSVVCSHDDNHSEPSCSGDGECSDGEECIDGRCEELATDNATTNDDPGNGECSLDSDCGDGGTCEAGVCQCGAGSALEGDICQCVAGYVYDPLSGECVDEGSSNGGCSDDSDCEEGESCNTDTGSCGDTIHCDGHDVDPLTDDDHCGSCSNSCANGESCDEGSCAAAAFLTVTIDEAASILDVEEGETLVIEAFVSNTGQIDATQDIVLKIDGDSIDVVSDVAVNASTELTDVTLQWATTTGDTGSYTAEVSSEDDVDSVTVTVSEP